MFELPLDFVRERSSPRRVLNSNDRMSAASRGTHASKPCTCPARQSRRCLSIQASKLDAKQRITAIALSQLPQQLRKLNHDSTSSTSPQAHLQTNLSTFTPKHSQNGERKGRDRRPVSPTTTTTENRKAQARNHNHIHNHNITSDKPTSSPIAAVPSPTSSPSQTTHTLLASIH